MKKKKFDKEKLLKVLSVIFVICFFVLSLVVVFSALEFSTSAADCSHPNWTGGRCTSCWYECQHPDFNSNGSNHQSQ